MNNWLNGWLDLGRPRLEDQLPNLQTEVRFGPYLLRAMRAVDATEWISVRTSSRAFLEPWEPLWGEDALMLAGFERRLRMIEDEWLAHRGYGMLLFHCQPRQRLIGGISLSQVRRGVAQAASMGYWMAASDAGQGHMRAALPAVLDFSFGPLRLHRVEAACMPENDRSRRLLAGTGFRLEGHAERYLKIQNQWRDHLLFGIDEVAWMLKRGEPAVQRQQTLPL